MHSRAHPHQARQNGLTFRRAPPLEALWERLLCALRRLQHGSMHAPDLRVPLTHSFVFLIGQSSLRRKAARCSHNHALVSGPFGVVRELCASSLDSTPVGQSGKKQGSV